MRSKIDHLKSLSQSNYDCLDEAQNKWCCPSFNVHYKFEEDELMIGNLLYCSSADVFQTTLFMMLKSSFSPIPISQPNYAN